MRPKGGWKSVVDVELAVAEYVEFFNHRRLPRGKAPGDTPCAGAVPSGPEPGNASLYRTPGGHTFTQCGDPNAIPLVP